MNWRLLLQGLRRLLSLAKVEKRQSKALLASFGLAFSLWLILTLTQEYTSMVSVPVKVWADQESFPLESMTSEVAVSIRGSGLDLFMEHLRFRRDTVLLSGRALPIGDSFLVFDNNQFSRYFASQVKINGISPRQIPVVFPRLAAKEVPVELATDLLLVPPLRLVSEPVLSPAFVTLRGQEAVLDTLESWKTARPTLRVDKPGNYLLDLESRPGISTGVQNVTVEVNLVRYAEVEIRLPVRVSGRAISSSGVRLSAPELTFFLAMPESRVPSFLATVGQDSLTIQMSDLHSGQGIWMPPGELFGREVRILRTEPQPLRYVLFKRQERL